MIKMISLANDNEVEKWDNFVNSHPKATPFHHSSWLKTISDTYSFPSRLYVKERGGRIVGIAPIFVVRGLSFGKRLVSIPFSDYGGPLFLEEKDESHFLDFLHSNEILKSIEMRGSLIQNLTFVNRIAFKKHQLNLGNKTSAELYKTFDKKTIQYSIRKATKNGVEIVEDNTSAGVDDFYRLHSITRKKNGVPCQPRKFFDKIFEEMIRPEAAFLLFANYESKRIASGLFLKFGDYVYYKYNASDPAYLTKATPNHLLMWTAIEKARSEGYKFFDLGRTSCFAQGLLRYKRMWGVDETDLSYNYFPKVQGATAKEGDSNFFKIGTKVWKSLPDGISDKIGPMLFKYLA